MKKDKNFNIDEIEFKMVFVEGGTFTMGATSEQGKDTYKDEYPTHRVTLSDYYIGETKAYAIKIGNVRKYKHPKKLTDLGIKKAPQSFIYL